MKRILLIILITLLSISPTLAQEENVQEYKGRISEIREVSCSESLSESYKCFEYTVYVDGIEKEIRTYPSMSETGVSQFEIGDKVYVSSMDTLGEQVWNVTGFVRDSGVFIIFLLFALISVLVGGKNGFGSLLSLVLTILILYVWAIPQMLNGWDVIFVGLVSVGLSMVISMYISHGFNVKTTVSVISTILGLTIVAGLAYVFNTILNVDGSGSEDAIALFSQTAGSIDLSSVYFISILIAAMGVIDDVVVSQVASVFELKRVNSSMDSKQLYKQSMNIGKDHISSMINTLFVAYAGSSLFLVMLLTYTNDGLANIFRMDALVEEVVRTMSASIGILLVVPISSFIASRIANTSVIRK